MATLAGIEVVGQSESNILEVALSQLTKIRSDGDGAKNSIDAFKKELSDVQKQHKKQLDEEFEALSNSVSNERRSWKIEKEDLIRAHTLVVEDLKRTTAQEVEDVQRSVQARIEEIERASAAEVFDVRTEYVEKNNTLCNEIESLKTDKKILKKELEILEAKQQNYDELLAETSDLRAQLAAANATISASQNVIDVVKEYAEKEYSQREPLIVYPKDATAPVVLQPQVLTPNVMVSHVN